jgi:hypothetical protein
MFEVENLSQINDRITRAFNVMDKVTAGMIAGNIRGGVIAGATGVGKSYSVLEAFERAELEEKIKFKEVKGSMSGIGLYQTLFEMSDPGSVLLLDDADKVFDDMEPVNLLKAALDTSKKRRISWIKESRALQDAGIPTQFEYNGSIMFISNKDFVREIERETKIAPHLKAIIGRSLFLDLGIHTQREIFVRLMQVVNTHDFMTDNGITGDQAATMLGWIYANLDRVRVLSIRTAVRVAGMIKTDPDWRDMAEVLVLKKAV